MKIPSLQEAEELIAEAERRNPGLGKPSGLKAEGR